MAHILKLRLLLPVAALTVLGLLSACQPNHENSPNPNAADEEENLANTKDPDYYVEPDIEESPPSITPGQTPLAGSESMLMQQVVTEYQPKNVYETNALINRPLAVADQKNYAFIGMLDHVITQDGRKFLIGRLGPMQNGVSFWYVVHPKDQYFGDPLSNFRVKSPYCFVGKYIANLEPYEVVPSETQTPVFEAFFLRADNESCTHNTR